ncbi:hypothetical protein HDU85_000040 [Gaertneriomyces sp. JEL0708]|nr:hypothetical protein HDU85_000040 [Gaertneriomyces sp. JEL0708]
MGKAGSNKKKKSAARRADPLGLNSEAPVVSSSTPATAIANGSDEILPLVKKLTSMNVDDRAWAATALSNLVLDRETRKKLLAGGILDALIRLLCDTQPEVVQEAAGALRNLAVVGGNDICIDILRKNAHIALLALVPKLKASFTERLSLNKSEKTNESSQVRCCFDIAEQVIGVLWCLAEVSERAVEALTSDPVLIPFLLSILTCADSSLPFSLVQSAAQCLNTLVEDNDPCHVHFSPQAITLLLSIAAGHVDRWNSWNANAIHIRALVASVLFNVKSAVTTSSSSTSPQDLYNAIYAAIAAALDLDLVPLVAKAQDLGKLIDAKDAQPLEAGPEETAVTPPGEQERAKMEEFDRKLETVIFTLEVFANVSASEEEDGWADDLANENEDSEMIEDNDDVGQNGDNDDDGVLAMMEDDSDVLDAIREQSGTSEMDTAAPSIAADLSPALQVLTASYPFLFEKAVSLSQPVTPPSTPHASNMATHLRTLQTRALGVITNILNHPAAARAFLTTPSQITLLWGLLFTVAQSASTHLDLIEAAITSLYTLLRFIDLSAQLQSIPLSIPLNDADALLSTVANNTVPEVLRVKCISVLGLLARIQSDIELNRRIGTACLSLLSHSHTPLDLVIEILNQFYDIYADAAFAYDAPVFVQQGFLDTLKALEPELRKRVKAVDRRKHKQRREAGELAYTNLVEFIKYKASERA